MSNIVFPGTPKCRGDDLLGATAVASLLVDIDVAVDSNSNEAYGRFGKPERTSKSRETMVRLGNRKY